MEHPQLVGLRDRVVSGCLLEFFLKVAKSSLELPE